MKRLILAALVLCLTFPGLALATSYTPTVDDIKTWGLLDGTTYSTLDSVEDLRPYFQGIKFTGNIYGEGSEPSSGFVAIGSYGIMLDLFGFTDFAINIYNQNENPWNYSLFLFDGANYVLSSFTEIANGSNTILQLNLSGTGLDLSNIVAIGFVIEQTVPMLGQTIPDRTFETAVAPVPEPGTILLLGAGLVGLGLFGRRRMNKT